MKVVMRALLTLICIILPFSITYANSDETEEFGNNTSVLLKKQLRVLHIGNSYTTDVTSSLSLLVRADSLVLNDLCIYKCARGAASFKSWYDIYNDLDSVSTYSVSKVIGGLPANVQIGRSQPKDGSLFRDVLSNEKWDLIIIQQRSNYAPYYETWAGDNEAGYLNELLYIIKEKQPEAKIGCLLVHSYWGDYKGNTEGSSYTRWQLIANSIMEFTKDYGIDFVIPYGTAIQNLRSSSLNNEYDLTRDGVHCGLGLAQYTAACCYYEALFGPRYGKTVLGNTARVKAPVNSNTYSKIDVTDENAYIAQMAAYLATKEYYSCLNPEDYVVGVPNVVKNVKNTPKVYNIQGIKNLSIIHGLNIMQQRDGTFKKVLVK